MGIDKELNRLHGELGWKRLSPVWAKVEILLGLTGFVAGLLIGLTPESVSHVGATALPCGAALSVLGGYLTLAGHRSHLYQSNTKLAAYLICRGVNRAVGERPPSDEPHATDRSNLTGPDHD